MKRENIPWPSERSIPEKKWRRPAGVRVISADDHMQEPENLWQEKMAARDRDRAPKLWKDANGVLQLEAEGRSFNMPGWNPLIVEGRTGYWDLKERLKDMDAEGIDASIVFHGRAMALFSMQDKDLFIRSIDVYNEYMASLPRLSNNRLHGVAILPTIFKPEATHDYLQKLKAWGFKALEIPTAPRDVRYNASEMEPMWKALGEAGIPVSFHVGGSLEFRGAGSLGANITKGLQPYRPLWCMLAFSGILERHPGLKCVFTEGGASWVASALYDADKIYRTYQTEVKPKLANLPSYYWKRQCYATFMDDPVVFDVIDRIGDETIMWSTDYPHPESVLGESDAVLADIFDTLGEERARRVVGGNAAKLWGI